MSDFIVPEVTPGDPWANRPVIHGRTALKPWANRTEAMRCASCMWFNPKRADKIYFGDGSVFTPGVELGRCRRHAPTMSGFPVVFVTDWCGDHKLNENWVASKNDPPSPIS